MGIIFSVNDSGLNNNSYTQLEYEYINNKFQYKNSYKYVNEQLSLGDTVDVNFWIDPTLGSGFYFDHISKSKKETNSIFFIIPDSSGIYSEETINSINLDKDKNGYTISENCRSDVDFYIDYNNNILVNSSYDYGYWCRGIKSKITLVDPSGINLLLNNTVQSPDIYTYKYDTNGVFNLCFVLDVDLTKSEYDFYNANYSINNCMMNVKLLNKYNYLIENRTYSGINITVPQISGSIYNFANAYKANDNVTYYMNRNSLTGHQNYTELVNVKKYIYSTRDKKLYDEFYNNFINNNVSYDRFTIPSSSLSRGDFCCVTYEPLLQGVKPSVSGNIITTNYVTYCRGHKFWIDNVELRFGYGGSFGDDVIDSVTRQNPYVYVNDVTNSGIVRVTLDINHEDWTTPTGRSSYSDTNIYPELKTAYIAAVQPSFSFSFEELLEYYKYTHPSYDSYTTYPNVDCPYLDNSILFSKSMYGYFSDSIDLGSTNVELTSQNIDLVITTPGLYNLYLSVVDIYDQVSLWCITNKRNNFNIPFFR